MKLRLFKIVSVLLFSSFVLVSCAKKSDEKVIIGVKNTIENKVYGEIMSQYLDKRSMESETIVFADSKELFEAASNKEIDVYADYTATSFADILGEDMEEDEVLLREVTREIFLEDYNLITFGDYYFNNPVRFVIKDTEENNKLRALSEIEKNSENYSIAMSKEFHESSIGFDRFKEKTGEFEFKEITIFDDAIEGDKTYSSQDIDILVCLETEIGFYLKSEDYIVLEDDVLFEYPNTMSVFANAQTLEKNPALYTLINDNYIFQEKETIASLLKNIDSENDYDVKGQVSKILESY